MAPAADKLQVDGAWTHTTTRAENTAALYVTITNVTDHDDALTAASSDAAGASRFISPCPLMAR